jgi:hypothetical protein
MYRDEYHLATISPALGCFDGFGVLELGAPDVVPEFGCYTETGSSNGQLASFQVLKKCLPKFKVLIVMGQMILFQLPHVTG